MPDDICGRLRLRAVEPDDADFMYLCDNDSSQWQENGMMAPFSRALLKDYASNYDADIYRARQLRLICRDGANDSPVGIADIFNINFRDGNAFAGVYTLPGMRRRGIAAQMLRLLCDYAFNVLGLQSVAAKIAATNEPSLRTFVKAGFSISGTLKDWIRINGSVADVFILQLSRNQFIDGFSGTTSQLR